MDYIISSSMMKSTSTTKGGALLLLHLPSHTSISNNSLLFFFPQKPISLTKLTVANSLFLQPLHICKSNKWDSNAESIKNQNFSKIEEFEDEEDEFLDQGAYVLEEYIDSIWIFKVFRSYGWALPPILIALLVTGGPKAFLMALAVPLGQSTFSFAIQKMLDGTQNKPRGKSKIKKRQRAPSSRKAKFDRRGESSTTRKRKVGYQPWVTRNGVSASKGDREVPKYGGWDELDQESESNDGFETSTQSSVGASKIPMEKGKLSRAEAKGEAPLLLRLLIAIFPFLASWTKLL